MRYVTLLFLLSACSPQSVLMVEDLIEGEVKVLEHVVEDEMGVPHPQSSSK
jgi:hypothetical protein